jgi:hypothetical protein
MLKSDRPANAIRNWLVGNANEKGGSWAADFVEVVIGIEHAGKNAFDLGP